MAILSFFGESDTSARRKSRVNFKSGIQNGQRTSDYESKRSAPRHFFPQQLSSHHPLRTTWGTAAPVPLRSPLTDFCSGALNFLLLQEQPANLSVRFQRAVLALALTEVQLSNAPCVTDKPFSHRKGRELPVKRRTNWRTYALFSPEAILIRFSPCYDLHLHQADVKNVTPKLTASPETL